MRSFRHWKPTYIRNHIVEIIYQKRFPDHPWLTRTANLILSSYLRNSDYGFEWGSGQSTLWFSQRVSSLISIEHDPIWYDKILKKLNEKKIGNVKYLFYKYNSNLDDERKGINTEYVQAIQRFPEGKIDFVLIDGVYRSACAIVALERIRPGGILIVDNINWYLPSSSMSPNSRSYEQGPVSQEWAEFQAAVRNWRCIWTSNGVTDTTLWLKPCL